MGSPALATSIIVEGKVSPLFEKNQCYFCKKLGAMYITIYISHTNKQLQEIIY
jgi:hypothetical protein